MGSIIHKFVKHINNKINIGRPSYILSYEWESKLSNYIKYQKINKEDMKLLKSTISKSLKQFISDNSNPKKKALVRNFVIFYLIRIIIVKDESSRKELIRFIVDSSYKFNSKQDITYEDLNLKSFFHKKVRKITDDQKIINYILPNEIAINSALLYFVIHHGFKLKDDGEDRKWVTNYLFPLENNYEYFKDFLKVSLALRYFRIRIGYTYNLHDYSYVGGSFDILLNSNIVEEIKKIPNRSLIDSELPHLILRELFITESTKKLNLKDIEIAALLMTKIKMTDSDLIKNLINVSKYLKLSKYNGDLRFTGKRNKVSNWIDDSFTKISDLEGLERITERLITKDNLKDLVGRGVISLFDLSQVTYILNEDLISLISDELLSQDCIELKINMTHERSNSKLSKSTYLELMDKFSNLISNGEVRLTCRSIKSKHIELKELGRKDLILIANHQGRSLVNLLNLINKMHPQLIDKFINLIVSKFHIKLDEDFSGIIHVRAR